MTQELAASEVDQKDKSEESARRSSIISWIIFLLMMALIFIIFRFAIGIIVVSGNSMSPTIENKNIILSNNLFYTLEKNDIILFRDDNGFDVIKRIVALPNETIEIKDGFVYVDGSKVNEEFTKGFPSKMDKVIVTENSYFVIGDNRAPGESLDSRSSIIGSVEVEKVKGKIIISLYPFSFIK